MKPNLVSPWRRSKGQPNGFDSSLWLLYKRWFTLTKSITNHWTYFHLKKLLIFFGNNSNLRFTMNSSVQVSHLNAGVHSLNKFRLPTENSDTISQITVLLVCAFFSSCFGSYGPDYGYENGPGKKPEGSSGQSGHVVQAALHSKHTIRYVNVDIPYQEREPSIIQVEGGAIPLEIHFKSASSRIRVRQSHSSAGAGEVKHTSSEEEPTRLVHSVTKPIIQEVREIITPYRRVIQVRSPRRQVQSKITNLNSFFSRKLNPSKKRQVP